MYKRQYTGWVYEFLFQLKHFSRSYNIKKKFQGAGFFLNTVYRKYIHYIYCVSNDWNCYHFIRGFSGFHSSNNLPKHPVLHLVNHLLILASKPAYLPTNFLISILWFVQSPCHHISCTQLLTISVYFHCHRKSLSVTGHCHHNYQVVISSITARYSPVHRLNILTIVTVGWCSLWPSMGW